MRVEAQAMRVIMVTFNHLFMLVAIQRVWKSVAARTLIEEWLYDVDVLKKCIALSFAADVPFEPLAHLKVQVYLFTSLK